ncbi:MAG: conjugal transfer protein TrbE [Phycisphaerae bacterium]|jgi:type IV secretion system protein VirB4
MWNLREYRHRAQRLSDHLPWAALIDRGVILNKDGSFQTTIRFRGPDVDSATPDELMALRARMNNVLRRLPSNFCVQVDATRRPAPLLSPGEFPNAIAQRIETERQQTLCLSPAFESVQHFTLTYLPLADHVRRAADFLMSEPERTHDRGASFYRDQLQAFERRVAQVINVLTTFMPEVRRLDDDETLSYLHDCVSERQLSVKTPHVPCYLDEFLTDTPLIGGLSPRLGRNYLKVVSVRAYINKTTPCLLDALNELPVACRWCARYLPMDKDVADAELKRLRRHWYARRKGVVTLIKEFITKEESALTDTDSLNKVQDVSDALDALGADCCSFGHFTLTITTWDPDEHSAEEKAQVIQRVCDSAGLVSRIEDFNAVQAWLGSLPGHAYADVRRPILSSLNLCDLIPTSSVWSGEVRNAHLDGPPLAVVHTTGSTPFRLNLHHGDVGHTLVAGPTGSGKSTLLNFIAQQSLRYPGAQVYLFDKGRSCLPMTLAMRGDFYDLTADAATVSFQPLAALDREGELTWAHGWLIDILLREGVEVSPTLKGELWSTLTNLASMPVAHRTLTTLLELLQSTTMRQALHSYTLDGPHGHLLDADHDALCDGSWQAFEMEALMHSPALVPVLLYLFHRLEQRFAAPFTDPEGKTQKPRPTFMFLDEAWLFLANSTFATKIREWLKTLRKKNVAVLFATQSLADIAESSIATAIIESCPTRIFLPNPSAFEQNTRTLYESFGLNERQIAILQSAVQKQDYYYQSPSGNRLFQLGLGPVALALCGGGSPKVQAAIPSLIERYGTDGMAEAYLQELGGLTAINRGDTQDE